MRQRHTPCKEQVSHDDADGRRSLALHSRHILQHLSRNDLESVGCQAHRVQEFPQPLHTLCILLQLHLAADNGTTSGSGKHVLGRNKVAKVFFIQKSSTEINCFLQGRQTSTGVYFSSSTWWQMTVLQMRATS